MNKRNGFNAGRTPTTKTEQHSNFVDFQNELVQQLHRLILRINALEKKLEDHVKENSVQFATLDKKIVPSLTISTKANAKNIKFGLSEEALVDTNTVFISGTDKKLKFKNDAGVVTIL